MSASTKSRLIKVSITEGGTAIPAPRSLSSSPVRSNKITSHPDRASSIAVVQPAIEPPTIPTLSPAANPRLVSGIVLFGDEIFSLWRGPPIRDCALASRAAPAHRVFCELVGSTELSRTLDPEQLRELMRDYQQACGSAVEKYEGHVAHYLGDGLMVYFG